MNHVLIACILIYHANYAGEILMHVIKLSEVHVHGARTHIRHYSVILYIMKAIDEKILLSCGPIFFNSCDCYQRLHLVTVTGV